MRLSGGQTVPLVVGERGSERPQIQRRGAACSPGSSSLLFICEWCSSVYWSHLRLCSVADAWKLSDRLEAANLADTSRTLSVQVLVHVDILPLMLIKVRGVCQLCRIQSNFLVNNSKVKHLAPFIEVRFCACQARNRAKQTRFTWTLTSYFKLDFKCQLFLDVRCLHLSQYYLSS